MKKFLLTFAAIGCAMAMTAATARTYTCHIKVTINGTVTEQDEVKVDMTEDNGYYSMNLKNFVLKAEGQSMPVGNIVISNVTGVDEHGYTTVTYKNPIVITAGDDPAYDYWMGPMLGQVPIDAIARFTSTAVSASIDIDMMSSLQQVINVSIFGVAPAEETGNVADVNKDREVNVADVNTVIDVILNKQ